MPSSRVDKYEKRRKNTKRLSFLLILVGVLIVVLIGFLIFGGDGEKHESSGDPGMEQTSEDSQSKSDTENHSKDSEHESDKDHTDDESASDDSDEDDDEPNRKKAKSSDDNVQKAYTADWEPVGTDQTGSHTVNYDDGSQDRQEMRQAVAAATDLNENDFTMWWVERNGDQQVINTVSDPDETNIYRVYNKWVANEGWKPTKVEKLKENDKK